ncbi:MAG: hypothetical protein ACRDPM_07335 [Solirubrobacteraceae bacterium]
MRRHGLTAVIAFLFAAGVAAAAGPPSLPSLFARQITAINRVAHAPPVLLPRSMPLDAKRLFATGGAGGGHVTGYDLEVGAVKHCGGANACFVAGFTAATRGKVFGKRVAVRGASRAAFTPLSCGASCSPPQIDFVWHGVLYTIQANLKTKQTDRAALIAAAQSAISAGPR